ncbi:VanZ family protein [Holophaga foetida]|uniref:VanZ family protein n=1 Tax=Holophaga foetida TaxID=35839 RepID=UPI0002472124|nr:VanZ family protein [Holophaga foetida]
MLNRRAFFWFWAPALAWAGLICAASSAGFSSGHTGSLLYPIFKNLFPHHSQATWELVHLLVRKLSHWAEYFILAVLLYRGFRKEDPALWNRRWAIGALALVAALALGDEFHQTFVSERSGSFWDSLLDIFGGACGIGCEYLLFRVRRIRWDGTASFRYPD